MPHNKTGSCTMCGISIRTTEPKKQNIKKAQIKKEQPAEKKPKTIQSEDTLGGGEQEAVNKSEGASTHHNKTDRGTERSASNSTTHRKEPSRNQDTKSTHRATVTRTGINRETEPKTKYKEYWAHPGPMPPTTNALKKTLPAQPTGPPQHTPRPSNYLG